MYVTVTGLGAIERRVNRSPGLVTLLEGICGGNDHHVYFGRVHSVSTLIFLDIFSMDVHFKFLVGLKTFLNSIMYIQSGFKLVFNYRFYNVTPQMPSLAHASS